MAYTVKNNEGHESTEEWASLDELLAAFGPEHCEGYEAEGARYAVWQDGKPTALTLVVQRSPDGRLRGVLYETGG